MMEAKSQMQFMVLIYIDPELMDALPPGEADAMLHECFDHADQLRGEGRLLESQMLGEAKEARTLRVRRRQLTATDGPFAETKEVLGGFNLIEAEDIDEAVRMAAEFPWTRIGSVEVRPVRDLVSVRERVAAAVESRSRERKEVGR